VGFAGHIVHSSASGPWNIDALFFMLGWDQYGFHKKRTGTRYAELVFFHPVRSTGHVVHSSASGAWNVDAQFFMLVGGGGGRRPVWIPQSVHWETLHRTCVFTSDAICRSRSEFWCVRAMKHWCIILHAQVDQYKLHKKRAGTLSHPVLRWNWMLIVSVPGNQVYTHTIPKMGF
jgi:hypothetical protein